MLVDMLQSTLHAELPGAFGEVPFWRRWRGCKRWPLARAVRCGIELADALHYVQNDAVPGTRILHRDIKPANIGFVDDGRLVLFDFGLATLWHVQAEDGSLDETGRALTGETGSLRYMAPEVALGSAYGPKAEVFSFASVLWEMGAHERPFAEMHPDSFVGALSSGKRPKVPRKWPKELHALLGECWDLDAAKRPWFNQISRRLEHVLAQLEAPRPKRGATAKYKPDRPGTPEAQPAADVPAAGGEA